MILTTKEKLEILWKEHCRQRQQISLYPNPDSNLYLGVTSYLNKKFPERRHTLVDGFILTQTR